MPYERRNNRNYYNNNHHQPQHYGRTYRDNHYEEEQYEKKRKFYENKYYDSSKERKKNHSEQQDSNNHFNNTTLEDIFPQSSRISINYNSIQLANLNERMNDMLKDKTQTKLLDWIFSMRNQHCPLHSYSQSSRSINTLIEGYSNIGYNSIAFARGSGSFDKVISIENDNLRFNALKNNIEIFKLEKYIDCFCDDFLQWIKNNYEKIEYFKSIIYLDLVINNLILENIFNLLNEIFERKCPMIVLRLKYDGYKLFLDQIKEKVKCRDIIINKLIEYNKIYFTILPEKTEVLNHSQNESEFPTVQSRGQMNYIWYHSHGDIKQRFIQILTKSMLRKCHKQQSIVKDEIYDLMERESDDKIIYDKLFDLFQNKIFKSREYLEKNPVNVTKMSTDSSVDTTGRSNNRVNEIMKILPTDLKVKSFVDIGCSEGSITAVLGKRLELEKENIHGCDVRDIGKTYTQDFTFSLLNEKENKLPYEDSSQSLVVALMSLHHIHNVEETIKEIYRILEPNGILIIREHDASPKELSLILDTMHGFYSLVWSNPREMPNFCEEYFAKYFTKQEWTEKIINCGFKKIFEEDIDDLNKHHYRNNNDIINPFRYYHACYRKEE
ncbi:hypothetical protein ABK040_012463 [Willaertia magna]